MSRSLFDFAPETDLRRDIFNREKAAVATLPSNVLYKDEDLMNPLVDQNMYAYKLIVRLEHLQNGFFIYRMLKQRGHDIQADLVAVSFELVSLTLLYWTHLDRVPRIVTDLEWIVRLPRSYHELKLTISR